MINNTTKTNSTVSAASHRDLTEEQILVVSIAGACGALVVLVLVAMAYALVYSKKRQLPRHRHNSKTSVARSDFWPFAISHPPPSAQMSPDYPRHVAFEDDPRLTIVSRASHIPGARMSKSRANSLATLERRK